MSSSTKPLLAVVLFSLSVTACRSAQPRYPDAELVFTGTTVKTRASTVDAQDVSNLAIVRVEEILFSVPALAALTGTDVTVRLRDPARAREGERRVFFTNGWQWGDGIGVLEVGNADAPSPAQIQQMRTDIDRSRQQQSDQQIQARLRTAELVVAGRVTAVRASDIPRMPTEHDPEWREADIEVAAVLKGSNTARTVTIIFPGTDDPMWYRAPRFTVNQEGIWILHPFEIGKRRLPHLTALQPDDFRPRAEEERIRRLLR